MFCSRLHWKVDRNFSGHKTRPKTSLYKIIYLGSRCTDALIKLFLGCHCYFGGIFAQLLVSQRWLDASLPNTVVLQHGSRDSAYSEHTGITTTRSYETLSCTNSSNTLWRAVLACIVAVANDTVMYSLWHSQSLQEKQSEVPATLYTSGYVHGLSCVHKPSSETTTLG